MAVILLELDNMHCGACVRRVTQTLNVLPGVHADEVQIGSARITTQSETGPVIAALAAAGYPARVQKVMP